MIHLLADKGFNFLVEHPEPNLVITYFSKAGAVAEETVTIPLTVPTADNDQFDRLVKRFDENRIIFLDVRQLEVPQSEKITIAQEIFRL